MYVGKFLPDATRRDFNFCEMERIGLELFVLVNGGTVTAFRTDKGSTRVETADGYTVTMNGYVCRTEHETPMAEIEREARKAWAMQRAKEAEATAEQRAAMLRERWNYLLYNSAIDYTPNLMERYKARFGCYEVSMSLYAEFEYLSLELDEPNVFDV
jgi:hypothetical protein